MPRDDDVIGERRVITLGLTRGYSLLWRVIAWLRQVMAMLSDTLKDAERAITPR